MSGPIDLPPGRKAKKLGKKPPIDPVQRVEQRLEPGHEQARVHRTPPVEAGAATKKAKAKGKGRPDAPLQPGRQVGQRLSAGGLEQVEFGGRIAVDPRVPPILVNPNLEGPRRVWPIPEGSSQVPDAPAVTLDHHFQVIRSADLVSLIVSSAGLDLADGALSAAADGEGGLLVYTLPFQHLGERAYYEGIPAPQPDPDNPDGPPKPSTGAPETPVIPTDGRPARVSRVVVRVPAGSSVDVSTTGFLDALERFAMAVHPLATPGPSRTVRAFDPNLVNVLANAGLIQQAVAGGNAEVHALDTPAGVAQLARTLSRVRATLSGPDPRTSVTKLVADLQIGVRVPIFRNPAKLSRPPGLGETAIEAPYRLIISPSADSGWTHADDPVPDGSGTAVELWHTRLGHRDQGAVTEQPEWIRAVWARDREKYPNWATTEVPNGEDPFRMSLNPRDRNMLVRQTSETWARNRVKITDPTPVDAAHLYLSSLGAWLDLHGLWSTDPWSNRQLGSILSWDHEAPLGRDQYVRVTYPGHIFPFGHKATLVKVTERKIKDKADPKAVLFQRKFIVIGEPVKTYAARDLPFTRVEIAPTITPVLSPEPLPLEETTCFVVQAGGGPFQFVVHGTDIDGREVKLPTPLVWVADGAQRPFPAGKDPATLFANLGDTQGLGQNISFVPSEPGGKDPAVPTVGLNFVGDDLQLTSVPHLKYARASIPAVERMNPTGPQQFSYAQAWLDHGFEAGNPGEVWAALASTPVLGFGKGGASSGGAGGFVAPSLPIAGLSRLKGPVGDVAGAASGTFDPMAYLGAALPKLFGFVPLTGILDVLGLDDAPALVTESLAKVEALMADLKELKQTVEDTAAQAQAAVTQAQKTANDLIAQGRGGLANEVLAKAQDAATSAQDLVAPVVAAADGVLQAIIDAPGDLAGAPGKLAAALTDLANALTAVEAAAAKLTPLAKNKLIALTAGLRAAATDVEMVQSVIDFVQGIATAVADARFSFKWQPKLKTAWPSAAAAILTLDEHGFTLAVEGQAGAKPKLEILAELRGFGLILPPGEAMMKLPFDHLSFKAGSSGKVEVDAAVGNIEFVGILSFVERIKQLIPLDGFSDPPYVDVSPDGVVAGFSLELPNLAIGVFSLSNMALSADVRVPFLGDVVSVGFGFCTRERPFNLAVLCLGGGGWFGIRLSPRGLEVLELGLEAGAYLSINLGVASGSVSMAIGIYLRMEADKGSLTAYFRLRGEVSVLGLISASIELYLSLTYDFPSGKLTGTATITVKVKVLCFSKSVSITCQRSFAGSNGDPTFAEVMGVQPDFTSPLWTDYCLAFAEE